MKGLAVTLLTAAISLFCMNINVYAMSDVPEYFDFQDTVLSINAGETKTMWMRANYNYTYYLGPHSSTSTYLECSFASGTQNITFHIGADETVKNVFFYFYVDDDKVDNKDIQDNVEIYVQNIKTVYKSIPVTLGSGSQGTVSKNGETAVMYNQDGVAMASFALSNNNGHSASNGLMGVVTNGSKYFDVVSGNSNAIPIVSESDKGVFIANGFAGVCVNGNYKNWP